MPTDPRGSAAQERATVVAWLRKQARDGGEMAEAMEPGSDGRRSMITAASTYATAADLIEEGAHHAD